MGLLNAEFDGLDGHIDIKTHGQMAVYTFNLTIFNQRLLLRIVVVLT